MKFTLAILLFCLNIFSLSVHAQTDCVDAIIVCGNNSYTNLNATGIGIQELNSSNACSSFEHNSLWLKILIKDGGTLGMILSPESDDLEVDFDFWIYGPNVSCDALGTAVRCSTTNPLAAQLDFNHTGMNDTETDVSEGPGWDGNGYINWMQVEDDEIYYLIIDRPHGSANFSIEWTGTATFHEEPTFQNPNNIPLDLVQCDNDGVDDQSVAFDLTQYEAMFYGSQTDVEITYHLSNSDAVTGVDPLSSPELFANTESPQTIFLRMTNTVTGCYATNTFSIELAPVIVAGNPADMELCDTSHNGIRQFNLALNEAVIKDGNPECTVTYYTSQENAEGGTDPVGSLFENEAPYVQQTIWARLEKTNGCLGYDIKSFVISVVPLPEFNNPQNIDLALSQCDDDGIDDISDTFDLTTHEIMFTGNQANIVFKYFENMADAISGNNAIGTPALYANTSSPQTIYVSLYHQGTGCTAFQEFPIEITNPVTAGEPQNMAICDDDGTGLHEFDLSENDNEVNNGDTDMVVTYYSSEDDAENKTGALDTLHTNTLPYTTETIWTRLENSDGCFGHDIKSFTVAVHPLPVFTNSQNLPLKLTKCDDDGIDDHSAAFDLTVHTGMWVSSQSNMSLTYYTSETDALLSLNPINNPEAFPNTSNPQTIYVRMLSTATGCASFTNFEIEITFELTAGDPAAIILCDDDFDGLQLFDLAINDAAIIGSSTNTAVVYYATEQDALGEIDPLVVPYQNALPFTTETIWARLESTSGCVGHILKTFTITVLPKPEFINPQKIVIDISKCDDDEIDDISTAFDLRVHSTMFVGSQENLEVTYYENAVDADAALSSIQNPETYTNTSTPQTIYIRLTNTVTNCYNVKAFNLEIINPVIAGPPEDISLCDLHGNGVQHFALYQNDGLIKNGNTNALVTYYTSQEDAENEVNPLGLLPQNAVPYQPEMIWARVENISGCFGHDITHFTISVLPMPEIVFSVNVVDFTVNDNSITINIPDEEDYQFSIDGTNFSDDNVFSSLVPGVYTVFIQSKDNCRTAEQEVVILNYPKFFTPNGDGINEHWTIPYLSRVPAAQVYIFDRYAKLITGFPGTSKGWDGTYNGHALPATDYWFVLKLEGGRTIKGHFALIR